MNKEDQSIQESEDTQKEKKYTFKEPESPIINISSKKNPRTYKLVAKLILRKFDKLELRSLGNAASSVVVLAHSLVRNRYAVYDKIQSDITNLEDVNNESGTRKGIQFVIKLKKSEHFDKITQDLIQFQQYNINIQIQIIEKIQYEFQLNYIYFFSQKCLFVITLSENFKYQNQKQQTQR